MCPVASLQQAFLSCLPRNAAGKSDGDEEALGANCHPPSPPPPHLTFPPSPDKAKEKLMRTKKPAAHPLPHPSQWLCRKKPLLQAEVLSQKWMTEAPGRRGRGQMLGVFSQPGISSSLPEEAAFPSPSASQGDSMHSGGMSLQI